MSHSKTKWISGITLASLTLLGIGSLLWGNLNEYGVREGGFLTPTAYKIMKDYHHFSQEDEDELRTLASQNPNTWLEISQKIKDIPSMPIQKRMDVLYPLYKGKNANFPKKIIKESRNSHFLDISYNIPFQINPYCFYVSPQFKDMITTEEWLNWQIQCVQAIIQVGVAYGNAWEKPFPVSLEQSQQMQKNLEKQILSGNLQGYQTLFPLGYMMNEYNEYTFAYPANRFSWRKWNTTDTPYSFVLKSEPRTEFVEDKKGNLRVIDEPSSTALFNGAVIGKMSDNKVFSDNNGNQTLLFHGKYNKKFFQQLSSTIAQMAKETPSLSNQPHSNIDDVVQKMSDWTSQNEKDFPQIAFAHAPDNSLTEFKWGISYFGGERAP